MKKQELNDVLSNNTYPGRGICLGVDESGEYAVIVYFIMGRSVNSRNRVFAEEPDGIRTEAADPAKMEDPSLLSLIHISEPTPSGTFWKRASPSSRPCAPGNSSPTAPTGPPASPGF